MAGFVRGDLIPAGQARVLCDHSEGWVSGGMLLWASPLSGPAPAACAMRAAARGVWIGSPPVPTVVLKKSWKNIFVRATPVTARHHTPHTRAPARGAARPRDARVGDPRPVPARAGGAPPGAAPPPDAETGGDAEAGRVGNRHQPGRSASR